MSTNSRTQCLSLKGSWTRPRQTDTFIGKCERWSRKHFVRANRREVTGPDVPLSQPLLPLVRRCWDWVCDCEHCVEPLTIKRQPVKDVQIRSAGYDRRRGRLEIKFTWTDDVRQFYPVAPNPYRQLLAAKPMYLFLNRLLASRSVREQRVRTEADRALMMARELEVLPMTHDSFHARFN
jgi:hypothetical protein